MLAFNKMKRELTTTVQSTFDVKFISFSYIYAYFSRNVIYKVDISGKNNYIVILHFNIKSYHHGYL